MRVRHRANTSFSYHSSLAGSLRVHVYVYACGVRMSARVYACMGCGVCRSAEYEEAAAALRAHNPNDVLRSTKDWFRGVPERHKRYVPYNGGFGRAQLAWLRAQVDGAAKRAERVPCLHSVCVSVYVSVCMCAVCVCAAFCAPSGLWRRGGVRRRERSGGKTQSEA